MFLIIFLSHTLIRFYFIFNPIIINLFDLFYYSLKISYYIHFFNYIS